MTTKGEIRREKARAAARQVVDEAIRRGNGLKAPRAPGHTHRGRCGYIKCFPRSSVNEPHPEAVGGTE